MSVIREVTAASLTDAWRTIDIDALQEDSPANFDTTTLHPPLPETGEAEVRALAGQVRQLLRGGDAEGALRGCLEMPVYNGPDSAKVRSFNFSFFYSGFEGMMVVAVMIMSVLALGGWPEGHVTRRHGDAECDRLGGV